MVLLAVAIPFYLNDLQNIFVGDYFPWLLLDYALRVGVLVFLYQCIRSQRLTWADLGFRERRKDVILGATVVLGVIGIIGDALIVVNFKDVSYQGIGVIPLVDDPLWWTLDRYAGLLLVAASEEVVFRGLLWTVCREAGLNRVAIVLVSAMLFSLAHWSLSPMILILAFTVGALFMVSAMASGSIIPAIVVHYLLNFVFYN